MTAPACLARLGFTVECTGGGCVLMSRYLASGWFVWASAVDGPGIPAEGDWLVCAYPPIGADDQMTASAFAIASDEKDSEGQPVNAPLAVALATALAFAEAMAEHARAAPSCRACGAETGGGDCPACGLS